MEQYLKLMVEELPCMASWDGHPCASGSDQAHHFIGEFHMKGMGMKAPDMFAMPLCMLCHRKIHDAYPGWVDAQRVALIGTLKWAEENGYVGITAE